MQGNILIHPWSKNLLWILHEGVKGTCTVMLLHSNLQTWVLSSELLALLNAVNVLEESASGFRNALRCRQGIGGLEHIDSKPQMDHPVSHRGSVSVSR
jgi:hypothetical protein